MPIKSMQGLVRGAFCDLGGKNCMDMDTCSMHMHVHPTRLKMSKEMNQSISLLRSSCKVINLVLAI